MNMVMVSTIPTVVAIASVLIPIWGNHAAAEQRCESGKQHKNSFHQALLSGLRLFSAYAIRYPA
jgi:hypothetical protein